MKKIVLSLIAGFTAISIATSVMADDSDEKSEKTPLLAKELSKDDAATKAAGNK